MKRNEDRWEEIYRWNRENGNQMIYPDEDAVRLIVKFFPEGTGSVLDAGCGSGRHTALLLRRGLEVTACDPSETALELTFELLAEQVDELSLHQCLLTELPFPDQSFDAALCWGVLHYLLPEERQAALAELHRILKPGAPLACTLRSVHDSESRRDRDENGMGVSEAPESKGLAFSYFTEAEAREALSGFDVEVMGYKTRTHIEDIGRVFGHWFILCRK